MILIGKRIKRLRNRLKMTQEEFASVLGVAKSTVAAYENDSRTPSYETLLRISRLCNITIDSLLTNEDEDVICVKGLDEEQIEVISKMVICFRKSNMKGGSGSSNLQFNY